MGAKQWWVGVMMLVVGLVGGPVWGDQASDALSKAPAAVQAAVKTLVGDRKISEFDSEVEGGKRVYSVEYAVKGARYGADIDASGQMIERQIFVDLSIVPTAVIGAAKDLHAGWKIEDPMIVVEKDSMYFSVEVRSGKETREMDISANGEVISDSPETD